MSNSYIYVFVICACFAAQKNKMLRVYEQYLSCTSRKNITGKDAAEMILHYYGIFDMPIKVSIARLSDYYNPKEDTLYLSAESFESTSVSVIAVASHVAVHAVQHREKYFWARLCRFLDFPILLCSYLGLALYIISTVLFLFTDFVYTDLMFEIGRCMLCGFLLLILLKCPVEYNANRRAFTVIEDAQILNENEKKGAKEVLKTARNTDIFNIFVSQAYFILNRKFWC